MDGGRRGESEIDIDSVRAGNFVLVNFSQEVQL